MAPKVAALAVVATAIAWAAGAGAAPAQAPEFEKVQIVDDSLSPMALDIAPDGRVFYIERLGQVRIWKPDTGQTVDAATIPVHSERDNGLLGIALAPDFEQSNSIYLTYSVAPVETLTVRVSRFEVSGDTLDLDSEEIVYEWQHQRHTNGHTAGNLQFGPEGSLYISTGDNTSPYESDGYAPIDERPGREGYDAQGTSASTGNPNGKILRVIPNEDGPGHTIPAGNMFAPGTPQTLPEIYAMGFRNPFRFTVDPETGWVLMADYGPDAAFANPARGPQASVEWNVVTEPGFYGWPYCIRANTPYVDYDFATGESGDQFDCDDPVNDSPYNTGLTDLPAAEPASMWMGWTQTDARFPGLGTGGAPMSGERYHHDPSNPSPTKFPASLDGHWFIAEWGANWIKTVTLDEEGNPTQVHDFPLPGQLLRPGMDLEFGPDGSLYLIEWGSGFDGGNDNSGIYRIDHVSQAAPQVTASADPTRGEVPLDVQFDGAATHPGGSPNEDFEYEWDFGDGNSSTEEDPTHTYTEVGDYEATLTVTDPDTEEQGSDSVEIQVDPALNVCPSASRSDEFSGEELDTTRWSFLHPSTEVDPYVADDNLVFTLSNYSFDADRPGPTSILGQEMPEGDWEVVAKISAPGLNEDTTGQSQYAKVGLIAFQDNATEPNKRFISYTQVRNADGDGTENTFFEAGAQNGPGAGDRILGGRVGNAPASENLAGPFWIRMTRTGDAVEGFYSLTDPDTSPTWVPINNGAAANLDAEEIMPASEGPVYIGPYGANGSIDTTFDYVRVATECDPGENDPPVIDAVAADPDSGDAPLDVDFSVDASDPDGDQLSYEWDFGDGGTSGDEDPSHTYDHPGVQEAEVTVFDGELEASDTVTVTVADPPLDTIPPVTAVELNGAAPRPSYDGPVEATFTATDPGPDASGVDYTEYRVDSDQAGDWQTYNPLSPPTMTEPGAHEIDYRSADVAGSVEQTRTVGFEIADDEGGEPDLGVEASNRVTVKPREQQAKLRFRARNTGDAASGPVSLCVKAPKRKLKLAGKECITRSIPAGQMRQREVKLRVKRKARGKTTAVQLIARGPSVGTQRTTVRVRVKA